MPSISDIRGYVGLTRPQNASGSVLTYSIGYFLIPGASLGSGFFIGLLILLALHSLATVQNDIADFEVDRANGRRSVIQDGVLSFANAQLLVRGLAFVAIAAALLSPQRRIHLTAVLGLLLVAWLYNLNPVKASKRPILSISLLGLCYGALPFMYGYILANKNLSGYFWVMALLWFLARFSTAIMKDYKDADGDKLLGKNTFYLRYGRKFTAWTSIALTFIAYLGVIALIIKLRPRNSAFYALLLLTVILAMRSAVFRFKLLKVKRESQLNQIFHKGVFMHNQFEAAVLLCLILS